MKYVQIILVTVLFFILSSIRLSAQEIDSKKIHLKDDTAIMGRAIEGNDYHIKIMTSEDTLKIGNRNAVPKGEVKAVGTRAYMDPTQNHSGYFVNAGYQLYLMDDPAQMVTLTAGKRIDRKTYVGIELGYRWHDEFVRNIYINPKFATAAVYGRRYLMDVGVGRVFFDGSVGLTMPITNYKCCELIYDYNGGILASFSGGFDISHKGLISLIVKGGVTYSRTSGAVFSEDPFPNALGTTYIKNYLMPFMNVAFEF